MNVCKNGKQAIITAYHYLDLWNIQRLYDDRWINAISCQLDYLLLSNLSLYNKLLHRKIWFSYNFFSFSRLLACILETIIIVYKIDIMRD